MAELKNEGIPFRVYRDHPEIVPLGWDGEPAPTRTVDYLAPAFLAETERWYAAIMPVLADAAAARRRHRRSRVQLDNEVGMLAWVTNSPDLTDGLLAAFGDWVRERSGARRRSATPRRPGHAAWTARCARRTSGRAAALRVDLGAFMRERFAELRRRCATMREEHGIDGVPFLVNMHGTEGGRGTLPDRHQPARRRPTPASPAWCRAPTTTSAS